MAFDSFVLSRVSFSANSPPPEREVVHRPSPPIPFFFWCPRPLSAPEIVLFLHRCPMLTAPSLYTRRVPFKCVFSCVVRGTFGALDRARDLLSFRSAILWREIYLLIFLPTRFTFRARPLHDRDYLVSVVQLLISRALISRPKN